MVAVKIQHPDVRKNAYTDMDTMDVSEESHTKRIPYVLPRTQNSTITELQNFASYLCEREECI